MKSSLVALVPAARPVWRSLIMKRRNRLECASLLSEGCHPSVGCDKWYSASTPRCVSSNEAWQSEDLMEMEARAPRSRKTATRNAGSVNPDRVSGLPGNNSSGFDDSSDLRQKKRRKIADGAETVFGANPVLLALRARKRQFYRLMITDAKSNSSEPHILEILRLCAEFSVPVDKTDAVTLKIVSGDRPHQGVCLESSALKPEELSARDLPSILECDVSSTNRLWLFLDGIYAGFHCARRLSLPLTSAHPAPFVRLSAAFSLARVRTCHRGQGTKARKLSKMDRIVSGDIFKTDSTRGLLAWSPVWGSRTAFLSVHRLGPDPMNFGAITRSAYFFGVERVLMPDEESCPLSPVASKASAGTLELLPMHSVRPGQIREVVQGLREKSWTVIGTASKSESVENKISRCLDLRDVRPSGHTLLILGNESRGIRQPLLELCNSVVTIQPGKETLMEGADCLNVSVTAGIILSRMTSNSCP